MNITYRQKANLFHILALFPLIFLAVNDEYFKGVDRNVIKPILYFILAAGTLYHIYLFMYVNVARV
jgi:hypothetical protein